MNITPQDFEHLFEAAMEWDIETWRDQEARFDFNIEVKKGHIYWVENYPSLIMCRHFLNERGHSMVESFDEATQQWAFISSYDFHAARVSA
jgi:hypothetical protein